MRRGSPPDFNSHRGGLVGYDGRGVAARCRVELIGGSPVEAFFVAEGLPGVAEEEVGELGWGHMVRAAGMAAEREVPIHLHPCHRERRVFHQAEGLVNPRHPR